MGSLQPTRLPRGWRLTCPRAGGGAQGAPGDGAQGGASSGGSATGARQPGANGDVIDAEVVDETGSPVDLTALDELMSSPVGGS